jgi:hypothetical protein
MTFAVGEGARRIIRHHPTIEVGSSGDDGDFTSEGVAEAEEGESEREIEERSEERSTAAGEGEESANPASGNLLQHMSLYMWELKLTF